MHLKTLSSSAQGIRACLMCRLRVKVKGHVPEIYGVTEPAMTKDNALLCLASFYYELPFNHTFGFIHLNKLYI